MKETTRASIVPVVVALVVGVGYRGVVALEGARKAHRQAIFQPSDRCLACHNGLTTASGADVSIGADWRGSMMANASRDPYWQAAVRREVLDHPSARARIEDACATCHMPMARADEVSAGRTGQVFAHLPVAGHGAASDHLAHDGVSCAICHLIADERLGAPESFNGGFVLGGMRSDGPPSFGPFSVDRGPTSVMQSSSGFQPVETSHTRRSELCATCHTLYTEALDAGGRSIGRLPEQVPYLEWRHSAFAGEQTCQACHMPAVEERAPIASVLGEIRTGAARHVFRGGNFFVLGMLNRYRDELGVTALAPEIDASRQRTVDLLQGQTASVTIDRADRVNDGIIVDVAVRNLSGHKLPTGYPSRRLWLHLTVRDQAGAMLFESGGLDATGAIRGNDNDRDATRYEPHYREIRHSDEVQIYESILGNANGEATTGLLSGTRYLKDNRLLPRGFDKTTADADVAVIGAATEDDDFRGGEDRVRYAIDLPRGAGPCRIDLELAFQPIGFRWAQNLKSYDAAETRRFVTYYDAMSSASATVLARASAAVP